MKAQLRVVIVCLALFLAILACEGWAGEGKSAPILLTDNPQKAAEHSGETRLLGGEPENSEPVPSRKEGGRRYIRDFNDGHRLRHGLPIENTAEARRRKEEAKYKYVGPSGKKYKYDLNDPLDRAKYQTDVESQRSDNLDVDPRLRIDSNLDTRGAGGER